jgi:succinate dehydrogenase/fumarate reductase cytochrome b subunit
MDRDPVGESASSSSPQSSEGNRAATIRAAISCGIVIAVTCLLIAAVIGLRMALHATVVPCPDGTILTDGRTNCYSHKHAGQGTAIFLFSLVLLVLVGLAGLVAHRINDRSLDS